MTTYGTDRLRRSLDNQRSAGAMTYAMSVEDMEALVREVEAERDELSSERDHWREECAKHIKEWAARCSEQMSGPSAPLASDGRPLRIGETVWGQDGKAFAVAGVGPEFVWGRAEGRKTHKRLRPEWLTHERPDSWAAVERDAVSLDKAQYAHYDAFFNAAGLVARCKKLAGVE